MLCAQDAFNLNKDDYDAQQAACNLTIQHTVSDVVNGATPERVTDIVVEEEEEEGGRSTVSTKAVGEVSARLTYTITVRDPTYTIAMLRAELAQSVLAGTMDERLRFYAAQFGASSFANVTFGTPRVIDTADPSDSNSDLADWAIALIVIGGVLALVLIIGGVWWHKSKKSDSAVLPGA